MAARPAPALVGGRAGQWSLSTNAADNAALAKRALASCGNCQAVRLHPHPRRRRSGARSRSSTRTVRPAGPAGVVRSDVVAFALRHRRRIETCARIVHAVATANHIVRRCRRQPHPLPLAEQNMRRSSCSSAWRCRWWSTGALVVEEGEAMPREAARKSRGHRRGPGRRGALEVSPMPSVPSRIASRIAVCGKIEIVDGFAGRGVGCFPRWPASPACMTIMAVSPEPRVMAASTRACWW